MRWPRANGPVLTTSLVKEARELWIKRRVLTYLVSEEELERRDGPIVLVVLHLFDELDLLLAREEVNRLVAQNHHNVSHLVPKQPRLKTVKYNCDHPVQVTTSIYLVCENSKTD